MFIRSTALLVAAATITFALVGCASSTESVESSEDAIVDEGVVSVVLVERDPSDAAKDLFAVTCASQVKHVTRAQLNSPDPVCAGSSSGAYGLTCTKSGGSYYPTRIETGETLGAGMGEELCQAIVRASTSNLTCIQSAGSLYPTRIKTGETLGSGMAGDACVAVLRASRRSLTCIRSAGSFYPTLMDTGVTLGGGMNQDACIRIVGASSRDLTCTFTAGSYYPTRIATGETLGSGQTLDSCVTGLGP